MPPATEPESSEPPAEAPVPTAPPSPAEPSLSHGLIAERWPDVLGRSAPRARARFQAAAFQEIDGEVAVFELPNEVHRERCEQLRAEVEGTFSELLGQPVSLRLVAGHDDAGPGGPPSPGPSSSPGPEPAPSPSEEPVDLDQLQDAPPDGRSTLDRITDAFPGATVIENDDNL